MEFLTRLFDVSGFPARWECGSGWAETPWLGWLHILSDLGVWSAYLAIPLVSSSYFLLVAGKTCRSAKSSCCLVRSFWRAGPRI